MPRVAFTGPGGDRREIDVPVGLTLMEAARRQGIEGIIAQCGGACACATCHVYVGPAWLGRLPPPEDMEQGMLESAWERRGNSRLSCQILITADLDGIEVTVPRQQRCQ